MKVSIITVCYNSVKTLEKTIQSVLSQTYKNLEYIIIDGGSTDGTLEIIEHYKDCISLCISEPDNGIYDAMNKGIQHSHGDIIGIINSDDWYAENSVKWVVQYFQHYNVDVVYGDVLLIDENGSADKPKDCPLDTLWYQMALPHPTVFIKKQSYQTYGLYSLQYKLSADYELILRLYSNHIKFGYINKIIAYFRLGGSSQIYNSLVKKETVQIAYRYIDRLENRKYREYVLSILKKEEGWIFFEEQLEGNPAFIREILYDCLKKRVDEIVIFGCGIWGEKCYHALENANVKVKFFIDNNVCEQGKIYDKEVKSVSVLNNIQPYIIIAVKNSEEIERQLNLLGIKKFIAITQIVALICERYI